MAGHMPEIDQSERHGWTTPVIKPFHPLQIHPCTKVLHYASDRTSTREGPPPVSASSHCSVSSPVAAAALSQLTALRSRLSRPSSNAR